MAIGIKNRETIKALYQQRSTASIQYAISQIQQSELSMHVSALYLYGSCARNEQKYDSDVDLLLQMKNGFDIEKHSSQVLKLKGQVMPDDIALPEVDMKIAVGDSWKTSADLFYKNIRKDGKLIWQPKPI